LQQDLSCDRELHAKENSMIGLWPRLALAGLCLTVSAGFPAFLASSTDKKQEKAPPDLSGIWKYNEDLSQTPQQGMRESRPEGGWSGRGGRGGGMRRRGGGGGFPGGGAPGGAGARESGRPGGADGEAGFEAAEEAKGALTIAWAAPQLTVTYPGDRKRVFFTDGRKVKEDLPQGSAKTRARWTDGGSLEVVTKMDNGLTRTEIFEISNDGKRLFVIIGLEGRGPQPIKFHRVYDKFDAKDKEEDEDADPQLA
jgi:hypothetical protein